MEAKNEDHICFTCENAVLSKDRTVARCSIKGVRVYGMRDGILYRCTLYRNKDKPEVTNEAD